jgi:hypothetical protein
MGIVGAGFVDRVDAVRRLGFVDVVAVAGSTEASAKAKADALGARKACGSYEALLDDPDVPVVHKATPNYRHYPVNAAAIAKGKHGDGFIAYAMKRSNAHPPAFATFEDGYRANCIVEAILDSTKQGSVWTKVGY